MIKIWLIRYYVFYVYILLRFALMALAKGIKKKWNYTINLREIATLPLIFDFI